MTAQYHLMHIVHNSVVARASRCSLRPGRIVILNPSPRPAAPFISVSAPGLLSPLPPTLMPLFLLLQQQHLAIPLGPLPLALPADLMRYGRVLLQDIDLVMALVCLGVWVLVPVVPRVVTLGVRVHVGVALAGHGRYGGCEGIVVLLRCQQKATPV